MTATKVFVLAAIQGEDPPDIMVLGVFRDAERAERRKSEIDTKTAEYHRRVCDITRAVGGEYKEWIKNVSQYYKTIVWPVNHLTKYHSVDRCINDNSYLYRMAIYESVRKEFIDMTLALSGDGPKPPSLPPLVPLPSGPTFSSWQMSIHDAEVE